MALNPLLDEFTWERPSGRRHGFRWQWSGEDYFLARIPGVRFEKYHPSPGIFRVLANLRQEREDVLQFANRYGLLGSGLPGDTPSDLYFSAWRKRIEEMRDMVALADALNVSDWTTVRRVLRSDSKAPDVLAPLAVDRLFRVSDQRILEGGSGMVGVWNGITENVDIRPQLSHLHAFMFFQLKDSALAHRRYRACEYCHQWFEVASGKWPVNKITCSPACRYQLYRKRRQRAVELHSKGWSLKRIAKEIGSEIDQIKTWVSNVKE
jgi:hypothetical protein